MKFITFYHTKAFTSILIQRTYDMNSKKIIFLYFETFWRAFLFNDINLRDFWVRLTYITFRDSLLTFYRNCFDRLPSMHIRWTNMSLEIVCYCPVEWIVKINSCSPRARKYRVDSSTSLFGRSKIIFFWPKNRKEKIWEVRKTYFSDLRSEKVYSYISFLAEDPPSLSLLRAILGIVSASA